MRYMLQLQTVRRRWEWWTRLDDWADVALETAWLQGLGCPRAGAGFTHAASGHAWVVWLST